MKHGRRLLVASFLGLATALAGCASLPPELSNTLGRLGFGGPWGPYAKLAGHTWVSPSAVYRYEWVEPGMVLRAMVDEADGDGFSAVTRVTPDGDLHQESSLKDKNGKPYTIVRLIRYEGGALVEKSKTTVKAGKEQAEQPDTARRFTFDGAERLTVTTLKRGADGAWLEKGGYPLVRGETPEGQLRIADLAAGRCLQEAKGRRPLTDGALAAAWGAYANVAGADWAVETSTYSEKYSWINKGHVLGYRIRNSSAKQTVTGEGTICRTGAGDLVQEVRFDGVRQRARHVWAVQGGRLVEQSSALVGASGVEKIEVGTRTLSLSMPNRDTLVVEKVFSPMGSPLPDAMIAAMGKQGRETFTFLRAGSPTQKRLVAQREARERAERERVRATQEARRKPWSLLSKLVGSVWAGQDGRGYQRFVWEVPNQRLRSEWVHPSGGNTTIYTARPDGMLDLRITAAYGTSSATAWMLPGGVLHTQYDHAAIKTTLDNPRTLVNRAAGATDYVYRRLGADGEARFAAAASQSSRADAQQRAQQAQYAAQQAQFEAQQRAEQAAAEAEERAASQAMWGQAMAGLANGLSGNSTYGAGNSENPLDEANRQTMERTRQIQEDLARQERERKEREERDRIAADQQHARDVVARQEQERQRRQAEQDRRQQANAGSHTPKAVASAPAAIPTSRGREEPQYVYERNQRKAVSWGVFHEHGHTNEADARASAEKRVSCFTMEKGPENVQVSCTSKTHAKSLVAPPINAPPVGHYCTATFTCQVPKRVNPAKAPSPEQTGASSQ